MVKNEKIICDILPELKEFIGESIIIAHNAIFDISFLNYNLYKNGLNLSNCIIDNLMFSRSLISLPNFKLPTIANHFEIKSIGHRAFNDALTCGKIFMKLINIYNSKYVLIK